MQRERGAEDCGVCMTHIRQKESARVPQLLHDPQEVQVSRGANGMTHRRPKGCPWHDPQEAMRVGQ
eukprot:238559-Pelagomonas_calceolata.AAC.1